LSWNKTILESNKSRKKIAPITDRAFRKCATQSSPIPTKKFGAATVNLPCLSTKWCPRMCCAAFYLLVSHTRFGKLASVLSTPTRTCAGARIEGDSAAEETEYSGYFRKNSRALVAARYSAAAETSRGQIRSLALAAKLFPTTDPNHAEPLRTANFFTMEDIGGEYTDYLNDAELRSAPNVTPWRQIKGLPFLFVVGIVFTRVDKIANLRQVYQIAELGKPFDEPTGAPEFMRLLVASDQPRREGENLDIRNEVLAQIFDKGDPVPKRKLTFHIEVTDEGTVRNNLGFVRGKFKNWRRIGKLAFDNAVASYNGDFVLHFNHPGWRGDRNNPATAHRAAISRA
jgi:hypothetical protein